jgi:hypothetical protein
MPSVLEEVAVEQSNSYTSLVDSSGITVIPPSPSSKPLKTISDVTSLLHLGRKQDVKHLLRNNAWPVDSPIRGQLWSLLCLQHQNKSNNMSDGFYWDMVNQVFGSTELPDKPISLPPFVEPSHCQLYYLTHKGRSVADRVVSVLGYSCPDIVYSPTIYPICALLLHYMTGKSYNFTFSRSSPNIKDTKNWSLLLGYQLSAVCSAHNIVQQWWHYEYNVVATTKNN